MDILINDRLKSFSVHWQNRLACYTWYGIMHITDMCVSIVIADRPLCERFNISITIVFKSVIPDVSSHSRETECHFCFILYLEKIIWISFLPMSSGIVTEIVSSAQTVFVCVDFQIRMWKSVAQRLMLWKQNAKFWKRLMSR